MLTKPLSLGFFPGSGTLCGGSFNHPITPFALTATRPIGYSLSLERRLGGNTKTKDGESLQVICGRSESDTLIST